MVEVEWGIVFSWVVQDVLEDTGMLADEGLDAVLEQHKGPLR